MTVRRTLHRFAKLVLGVVVAVACTIKGLIADRVIGQCVVCTPDLACCQAVGRRVVGKEE